MLNTVNYLLWINLCIILLILSFYMTIKSKFIQFNIPKIIKNIFIKKQINSGISPFQTLMMTLGGKIGIGSISGVALAIYYGGIGTVFWMLIISLLFSVFTFYEVYLGNYFKELDGRNYYKGGPSFYIKKGLKNNKLSFIYTILIIICYNGLFLSIQSNTISKMSNINPYIIGFMISIFTLIIIYKGVKQIAIFSKYLVPFMIGIYVILSLNILFNNIDKIYIIFTSIMKEALNLKSFMTSFIPMIIISTQRTIFATESGLGTTAIASSTTNNSPITQGYLQLFGVYIISIIICLSTAIIILTTNYSLLNITNINGIELVIYAFSFHFGQFGYIILYIIVLLFCFSTIITGYYNGEACLKSLNVEKIYILKIITIIVLFFGVMIKSSILWNIADLLIGIILIINVYSVYKLKYLVKE